MSKNEVSYLTGAEQAIPLERLRPFANHPFQVRHDLEMRELMDSIGESGIITPILVRPKETGCTRSSAGTAAGKPARSWACSRSRRRCCIWTMTKPLS